MSISLSDRKWKEFFVKDIFPMIQRGKRLTKAKQIKGLMPYISSTGINNGVDNYIANKTNVRAFSQCLTIANSGSVGASFYHPYKFVASDHVTHLKNNNMNKFIYLFIATITNRLNNKYNFSREINEKRISREKILLPINDINEPDYEFMEQYSKVQINKKLNNYKEYAKSRLENLEYKEIESLEEKAWSEFFIEDIANIFSGKDIYAKERVLGDTPYISATSKNNGIGYFISNENKTIASHCLSVNRNGSVGYSFYHPYNALFSNDCRKLKLKVKSKYVGIFVSNQITMQKEKYNYGYKMGTGRLKRQKILLPINNKNEPDYAYMEQYIKNLEYTKIEKYLEYL